MQASSRCPRVSNLAAPLTAGSTRLPQPGPTMLGQMLGIRSSLTYSTPASLGPMGHLWALAAYESQPRSDQPAAALIRDLKRRGLLESTRRVAGTRLS